MNVNSLEQMPFLIENCICPSVPFTFCGSNEILDSNFSSEKKLYHSMCSQARVSV